MKHTPLGYKSNSKILSSHVRALQSAWITIKDTTSTSFNFLDIILKENSTFSEPYSDIPLLQYRISGESIDVETGSTMIFGVNSDTPVITLSKHLFVSSSSSIKYDKEITILCQDRITLQGNLTAINFDAQDSKNKILMTKIISETKLIIDSNVIIHWYACIIIGIEDIQISGRILNDKSSCLNDSK